MNLSVKRRLLQDRLEPCQGNVKLKQKEFFLPTGWNLRVSLQQKNYCAYHHLEALSK